MSATMATQGGWVQLDQSYMRLDLNMTNMTEDGFSCTAIEDTQYLIKKSLAKVQEEKQLVVLFPVNKSLKAATERQAAMLHQSHTAGCLSCQNGTSQTPQTSWSPKGIGAPPIYWPRWPTTESTPLFPRRPPAPTCNTTGPQSSEHDLLPTRYAYSHTSCPCAEFFTVHTSARIASTIQILIHICRQVMEHPLVGTPSAVWQCM